MTERAARPAYHGPIRHRDLVAIVERIRSGETVAIPAAVRAARIGATSEAAAVRQQVIAALDAGSRGRPTGETVRVYVDDAGVRIVREGGEP